MVPPPPITNDRLDSSLSYFGEKGNLKLCVNDEIELIRIIFLGFYPSKKPSNMNGSILLGLISIINRSIFHYLNTIQSFP